MHIKPSHSMCTAICQGNHPKGVQLHPAPLHHAYQKTHLTIASTDSPPDQSMHLRGRATQRASSQLTKLTYSRTRCMHHTDAASPSHPTSQPWLPLPLAMLCMVSGSLHRRALPPEPPASNLVPVLPHLAITIPSTHKRCLHGPSQTPLHASTARPAESRMHPSCCIPPSRAGGQRAAPQRTSLPAFQDAACPPHRADSTTATWNGFVLGPPSHSTARLRISTRSVRTRCTQHAARLPAH